MCTAWRYILLFGLPSACSGADTVPSSGAGAGVGGTGGANDLGAQAEIHPLGADAAKAEAANAPRASQPSGAAAEQAFVRFVEPGSGFSSDEVSDADRERVSFDAIVGAIVSLSSGDSVSGWTTLGNDLTWTGSRVAFRVGFGTEGGERRAFFTEAGNGTICDLSFNGDGSLSIRSTNELPPNP
jgi:hypothetical protein